jgi:hypothetical protein
MKRHERYRASADRLDNFKLSEIPKGRNKYCGPAAVAAIAGIDVDDASCALAFAIEDKRWIMQKNPDAVKGTCPREVKLALELHGYTTRLTSRGLVPEYRENFKDWMARTESRRGDNVYLVTAGRHWRVVHGYQTVCGVKRTPHAASSSHKPRSHVEQVYTILPY